MRRIQSIIVVVTILAALASCATTGDSAKANKAPKTIQVTVWRVQTATAAYADGIISAVNAFQYDEMGSVLKEEFFNGKKALQSQKTYEWKADGTVEIVTLNGTGDILGKASRTMKGDRIEREILMNPKGEMQSTEEYAYDSAGNKLRWTVKTAAGNQVSTEYAWVNGQIAGITVKDAGGGRIKRFARIYAESGLLASEEEYDANDLLVARTVYIREGQFVQREEKQSPTGAVLSSVQYVNDSAGNPVEIREMDRTGRVLQVKTRTWQSFTKNITIQ